MLDAFKWRENTDVVFERFYIVFDWVRIEIIARVLPQELFLTFIYDNFFQKQMHETREYI